MSRESYTPKATMAAEIQGLQIGLGTVDDQCPMDEGQQEENGCQEHMKMAFTLSHVPQCEKVLLVSLGRMQIFLTAFHQCNPLPPTGTEYTRGGQRLAENMRKCPVMFTNYFDMDINKLCELSNLVFDYRNTAAADIMLIALGKAAIIQNTIQTFNTLSMQDLMAQGLLFIENRTQMQIIEPNKYIPSDGMKAILSEFRQHKYSTLISSTSDKDLVNTTAFNEALIYHEMMHLIKSELERHHNQSQDELAFCATSLTSDMNLNGHTHSNEEEINVINELSALAAHLHHGSMKKIIKEVEHQHNCSSEELMTMYCSI